MILASFNILYEIIPSIGIWELRATPLWREPPSKSLSRYISLLGAHHSDINVFEAFYGVIGL